MRDKIHRGNHYSNIQFLQKNQLLDNKQIKILEIGSGTGALVSHLRDNGFHIIGTEYTEEKIEISERTFGNLGLLRMSGDKLLFEDNTFDLVISFDVFEHIPDTDKHLQEVQRVLKRDGIYAFGTPNKITNIPWEIIDKKSLTKWKEYHMSLHTYKALKKRLENNGISYRFVEVPIITPYFEKKIKRKFGRIGVWLVKFLQLDKWPISLKTNFYVIAKNEPTNP